MITLNRASWNRISAAYQARMQLPTDVLTWGVWCPDESQLRLLSDVSGKRCLVLGCGGGQDRMALLRMGVASVTGIDLSDEQIVYAGQLLAQRGLEAKLIRGNVEDLSFIESASIDLAISVHAFNYIEHIDRCFAEVYRVLVPNGRFVFSVQHPIDAMFGDEPPYAIEKPYFQTEYEWQWNFARDGIQATFRSQFPTVSEWFAALVGAGLAVERLLEPPPEDGEPRNGFEQTYPIERARVIPQTLIFAARKPGA